MLLASISIILVVTFGTSIVGAGPADGIPSAATIPDVDSMISRWPWQVYLTAGPERDLICAGSLIDSRHVLTAAHCVDTLLMNPEQIYVNVGPQGDHPDRTGDTAIAHGVVRVFIHEQYHNAFRGFDIALLRLRNPVNRNAAIALPPSIDLNVPNNASVVIIDFSVIFKNGNWQNVLQENTIWVLQPCDIYPYFQSSLQICAGPPKATVDACPGNSGGPLLYKPNDGSEWILIGFSSYAFRCGRPEFPNVYTRVSAHLMWIKEKLYTE